MGKILIKNKKNQFMPGENQDIPKKRKSLEDEVTDQPLPIEKDSTGIISYSSLSKLGFLQLCIATIISRISRQHGKILTQELWELSYPKTENPEVKEDYDKK